LRELFIAKSKFGQSQGINIRTIDSNGRGDTF
jgi:hypothetical protein